MKHSILQMLRQYNAKTITSDYLIEAWCGDKKLSIEVNNETWRVDVIRIWGSNINSEMSNHDNCVESDIREHVEWLVESNSSEKKQSINYPFIVKHIYRY